MKSDLDKKIKKIIEIVESLASVDVIEQIAYVNDADWNDCKAQIHKILESDDK